VKFQENWPISVKVMKDQKQNFEKAIRPVFTDQVTNVLVTYWKMKSATFQFVY